MRFIEDAENYAPLAPLGVMIEVQVWTVNFRDVFGVLGRLDDDDFGSECAGIVRRVVSQVTKVQPGDRVCASSILQGCMRTYVRIVELAVARIPDSMSSEDACGVINSGMTSWYSLVDVARLQKGEKVLIHAVSGATGQVAIQIAQMIGAKVFATVGYDHKKQLLIDEYRIPASNIFYSRDLSFAQDVMRETQGCGVDVGINSPVGEGLRASWECVAPYGRFVKIGKADIYADEPLPMSAFSKDRSFLAIDIHHTGFTARGLDSAVRLFNKTVELAGDGTIHSARPINAFPIEELENAFRYMQTGKNSGRVVIQEEPTSMVQVSARALILMSHTLTQQKTLVHPKTCHFDENATYVIAAGLGGVGRLILRWMATRVQSS